MSSIEALFASRTLLRILSLLLLNPDQEYYQAEVVKHIGGSLLKVQHALGYVVDSGLVSLHKKGRMSYYKANRDFPGFEDLKRFLLKNIGLSEVIREALQKAPDKIQMAFIYGSYARGQETSDSDIDVFILGSLTLRETAELLGGFSETMGREVNSTVYSVKDLQNKRKSDNRFVQELLTCPKIWLIGTEDEFRNLAEGRKA